MCDQAGCGNTQDGTYSIYTLGSVVVAARFGAGATRPCHAASAAAPDLLPAPLGKQARGVVLVEGFFRTPLEGPPSREAAVLATARETLYEEIVALASSPCGDDAAERVKKIMLRYRVQTKPGSDIPSGVTARDALGDRLLALWKAGGDDVNDKIGAEIDRFRMQVKQKPGAKKKRAQKPRTPSPQPAPGRPSIRWRNPNRWPVARPALSRWRVVPDDAGRRARPAPSARALGWSWPAVTRGTSTTRASTADGRPTSRWTKTIPWPRWPVACWGAARTRNSHVSRPVARAASVRSCHVACFWSG